MTDPEKMALKGSEYSPLNNISSGEELEQFSLPQPAPDRPKRRRKRKDFDSLKTNAVNAVRRNNVCSCCTCISVFMFVLLTSVVIGLTFTCVNLLQRTEEMQTVLDNLKHSKQTLGVELIDVRSSQEKGHSATQNLTDQLNLMNKTVYKVVENLNALKAKIDTIKVDHKQMSGETAIKTLSDSIATFGSDITSLNSDVLTLKQTSKSQSDVITDLDNKIKSLQTTQTTNNPADGSGGSLDTTDLLQKFININTSVSSQLSTFRDVLVQYKIRYEQKLNGIEQFKTGVDELMGEIRENVTDWMRNQMVAAQVNSSTGNVGDYNETSTENNVNTENVQLLTDRIDKLETFVHQVSLQLQDKIVSETDNKVVNLTITGGIEDIINRAFNTRYAELKDNLDGLQLHIGTNNAELSALDQRFNSLAQKVFELHSAIENLTKQSDNIEPETTVTEPPAGNSSPMTPEIVNDGTNDINETDLINKKIMASENSTMDTDLNEVNKTAVNTTDSQILSGDERHDELLTHAPTTSPATIPDVPSILNNTIADALKNMDEGSLRDLLKGLASDTFSNDGSTVESTVEDVYSDNHDGLENSDLLERKLDEMNEEPHDPR